MFEDKLAQQYQRKGGHSQWNYRPAPELTGEDKALVLLENFLRLFQPNKKNISLQRPPQEPLTLFGVDKLPRGGAGDKYGPRTLNVSEIAKYNPSLAQQYRRGRITDRRAQQIINNGNVGEWKRKAEKKAQQPTSEEIIRLLFGD